MPPQSRNVFRFAPKPAPTPRAKQKYAHQYEGKVNLDPEPVEPSMRGLTMAGEGPNDPRAPSAFDSSRSTPNYLSGSSRYRNPLVPRTRVDIENDNAFDDQLQSEHDRDLDEQVTANKSRDARLDASGTGNAELMQFLSPLAKQAREQTFQEGQRKYQAELPGKIAIAEANQPAKTAPIRNVNYQDPEGNNWTDLVNASGETMFHGLSQLPAGQKRQKSDEEAAISQIDQITSAGDATNWEGTGRMGYGTVQDKAMSMLGIGSQTGADLRASMSQFVSDIIHDKFGSAFTSTEKAQASTFVPSHNDSIPTIKAKFMALKNALATRHGQLQRGEPIEPLQNLMGLNRGAQSGQMPANVRSIRQVGQ